MCASCWLFSHIPAYCFMVRLKPDIFVYGSGHKRSVFWLPLFSNFIVEPVLVRDLKEGTCKTWTYEIISTEFYKQHNSGAFRLGLT
jgi:hypothetical protein